MRELHNLAGPTHGASPLRTRLINVTDLSRGTGLSPYILRHAVLRADVPFVKIGRKMYVSEEGAAQLLTLRPAGATSTSIGAEPDAAVSISGAGAEPNAESTLRQSD